MELNFFDTYSLIALVEETAPKASFFRDRYFPTDDASIFSTDHVLVEYRKADRKMAPFVVPRLKSIPIERRGYEVHEVSPAYIGVSRSLSTDDLKQRGFGEALYANSTPAQRAARLLARDLTEMDARITRREEWMACQTIINNGCVMQEMIDAQTKGGAKEVQYYDPDIGDEHLYTVATPWNQDGGDFFGDVAAMGRLLSKRGNRAADLLMGADVSAAILDLEKVQKLLDKQSGIVIGEIRQTLSAYDGVVYMGTLNFGGYLLNLISVDELYVDDDGTEQRMFPATSAAVLAPNVGKFLYAPITQIDYGSTEFVTHVGTRIPKFYVDQTADIRSLQVACRPLAAPNTYCPFIYAENVVA